MRVAVFCGLILLAGTCWAEHNTTEGTRVDVQAPGVRVQTGATAYSTTSSEKHIVRASELISLNVKNHADETVGEINDIVIDPNDGRVRYVAVSVGGFLGMGDQLFAIPWTSFECRKVGDERKVMLNIDRETLKNAKGFNQDNWPDMANERWQMENDRAYQSRATDRRIIRDRGVR